MKKILLTKGLCAIIDDEDFERVNQLKWCATECGNKFYALNNYLTRKYMHHFILGSKKLVDHIDGDGLNNCRSNIRFATKSQNAANSKKPVGFFWNNLNKNWRVRITVEGKAIEVGSFQTKDDAKRAYIEAKRFFFGEFACL